MGRLRRRTATRESEFVMGAFCALPPFVISAPNDRSLRWCAGGCPSTHPAQTCRSVIAVWIVSDGGHAPVISHLRGTARLDTRSCRLRRRPVLRRHSATFEESSGVVSVRQSMSLG